MLQVPEQHQSGYLKRLETHRVVYTRVPATYATNVL